MVEIINASKEISAPLDRVWDIISNVDDDEPRYWQGLNAVYNVRKKGNIVESEVAGGLRDLKGRQTVVLYPKKAIELTLTEGPMIGTRIITLLIPSRSDNETITTRVNVSWDIKLSDNFSLLFRGVVTERIAEATEEAIDRIARAVQ